MYFQIIAISNAHIQGVGPPDIDPEYKKAAEGEATENDPAKKKGRASFRRFDSRRLDAADVKEAGKNKPEKIRASLRRFDSRKNIGSPRKDKEGQADVLTRFNLRDGADKVMRRRLINAKSAQEVEAVWAQVSTSTIPETYLARAHGGSYNDNDGWRMRYIKAICSFRWCSFTMKFCPDLVYDGDLSSSADTADSTTSISTGDIYAHNPAFWQIPWMWWNYLLILSRDDSSRKGRIIFMAARKYLRIMVWKVTLLVRMTAGIWDTMLLENMEVTVRCERLDITNGEKLSYENVISSIGVYHPILWQFIPFSVFLSKAGESLNESLVFVFDNKVSNAMGDAGCGDEAEANKRPGWFVTSGAHKKRNDGLGNSLTYGCTLERQSKKAPEARDDNRRTRKKERTKWWHLKLNIPESFIVKGDSQNKRQKGGLLIWIEKDDPHSLPLGLTRTWCGQRRTNAHLMFVEGDEKHASERATSGSGPYRKMEGFTKVSSNEQYGAELEQRTVYKYNGETKLTRGNLPTRDSPMFIPSFDCVLKLHSCSPEDDESTFTVCAVPINEEPVTFEYTRAVRILHWCCYVIQYAAKIIYCFCPYEMAVVAVMIYIGASIILSIDTARKKNDDLAKESQSSLLVDLEAWIELLGLKACQNIYRRRIAPVVMSTSPSGEESITKSSSAGQVETLSSSSELRVPTLTDDFSPKYVQSKHGNKMVPIMDASATANKNYGKPATFFITSSVEEIDQRAVALVHGNPVTKALQMVAAVKLQSRARGGFAREKVSILKVDHAAAMAAAKVQARVRGGTSRRKTAAMKAVAIMAVLKLQARARGKVGRGKVSSIHAANAEAATKLQARVRGGSTRLITSAIKVAKITAILKLQARARRNAARRKVAGIHAAKAEAAAKLQAHVRGKSSRLKSSTVRAVKIMAVLKLQARVRANAERMEMSNMKALKAIQTLAVLRIQARARGNAGRTGANNLKALKTEVAMKLQARVRGGTSRWKSSAMKAVKIQAVLNLQARFRGGVGRGEASALKAIEGFEKARDSSSVDQWEEALNWSVAFHGDKTSVVQDIFGLMCMPGMFPGCEEAIQSMAKVFAASEAVLPKKVHTQNIKGTDDLFEVWADALESAEEHLEVEAAKVEGQSERLEEQGAESGDDHEGGAQVRETSEYSGAQREVNTAANDSSDGGYSMDDDDFEEDSGYSTDDSI